MRGRPSLLRVALPSSVCVGLLASGLTAASCGTSAPASSQPTRTIEPSIIGPLNIIDEIAEFTLAGYAAPTVDGGLVCDTDTGIVANAPLLGLGTAIVGPVSNFSSKCTTPGIERCITAPSFPDPTTPVVFSVIGLAKDLKTQIAFGCATLSNFNTGVADAIVPLTVTMHAVVAKQVCGDGVLQPPETCDPGKNPSSDTVCNAATCQTPETPLSTGTGPSGSITVTGNPGDKSDPSFLWPVGGNFLAFFTDDSTNSAATKQVSLRTLSDSFGAPVGTGVEQTESLFLPNVPNVFPPAAEAFDHEQPVAVHSGDYTYVAFADDSSSNYRIVLRAMDGSLNAQQSSPCAVSDLSGGESGSQTAPAMAVNGVVGSTDTFYIAWQDDSGNIFGRTYVPAALGACSTMLGAQTQLSTSGSNSHVSVAAVPAGWVVGWQSGANIVVRLIRSTGVPFGPQVPITTNGNTASSPTVGALALSTNDTTSTGPFVVTWVDTASHSIFAARYDSNAKPLDGSGAQISTTSAGGEVSPFVASNTAVGGWYVVTWADQGSSAQVRGRFLAGTAGSLLKPTAAMSPFLANAIDGTTNDFQVNLMASSRTRISPTVAVGDSYIAFGWADNSPASQTETFGIFGRRFPLPTQ